MHDTLEQRIRDHHSPLWLQASDGLELFIRQWPLVRFVLREYATRELCKGEVNDLGLRKS